MVSLSSNGLPHIPGLALAILNAGKVGSVSLVAVTGGVGAAAVGDEHQIILYQINGLLLAVLDVDNLLGNPLAVFISDDDVLHVHAVLDSNAVTFQILH